MRHIALLVGLIFLLTATLTACGGSTQPAQPPTPLPQATAPPPTAPPPPTATPEPSPTPLSLSDVASEFRTFVNEAHQYAIQVPMEWEITPRGARHADRIEVTAPGPSEIRGPNIVPPLTFAISALPADAGYRSFDDVEANRHVGDEIVDRVDLEVAGLPARRVHSIDEVFGDARHYIIRRDDQFFIVDVYGYDQAPIDPILNTFGPPPALRSESVTGQIQELDSGARTMTVSADTGSAQRVVWFTDTEILPQGRLEGHIDAGDHVTVAGIVAEDGALQATEITLLVPEHDGSKAVLEFQRQDGSAGIQESLVIFADGTARLQVDGEEPVDKGLAEDQWKTVKNFVAVFKPFAWHQEDNLGGPDNLVTDLDFYGAGKFEAAFDNQEEVVDAIQKIFAQLSE